MKFQYHLDLPKQCTEMYKMTFESVNSYVQKKKRLYIQHLQKHLTGLEITWRGKIFFGKAKYLYSHYEITEPWSFKDCYVQMWVHFCCVVPEQRIIT